MESWAWSDMSVPTSFEGIATANTPTAVRWSMRAPSPRTRSSQTTRLDERTGDKITLDEVERIIL